MKKSELRKLVEAQVKKVLKEQFDNKYFAKQIGNLEGELDDLEMELITQLEASGNEKGATMARKHLMSVYQGLARLDKLVRRI